MVDFQNLYRRLVILDKAEREATERHPDRVLEEVVIPIRESPLEIDREFVSRHDVHLRNYHCVITRYDHARCGSTFYRAHFANELKPTSRPCPNCLACDNLITILWLFARLSESSTVPVNYSSLRVSFGRMVLNWQGLHWSGAQHDRDEAILLAFLHRLEAAGS
jgi:hypothetical protein